MANTLRKNREQSLHAKQIAEINDEAESCNKKFQSHARRGDAQLLMQYFHRMHQQNHNFFYKVKFDEQHRIEHAFCADARRHAA
ncbi:hypothetical protein HN873_066008 [Arachis hypogaea]